MKIITKKITIEELNKMAKKTFGDLVKAVVDIEKEIIAIDGELHADEETLLINNGSKQENLWGINLYPNETDNNFIEMDSMINVRPSQGNFSRGVDDPKRQKKIREILKKLIPK